MSFWNWPGMVKEIPEKYKININMNFLIRWN
jgi:hypothetical protein